MDYLQKLINQTRIRLFLVILVDNIILIGGFWVGNKILSFNAIELVGFLGAIALVETTLIATQMGKYLTQPVKALWQAIMHLSPESNGISAPEVKDLHIGRELVANLTSQIYQLISVADKVNTETNLKVKELSNNFIAQNLPLPLFVLDTGETVKFANQAAAEYIGIAAHELIGKNIYMILDMSFQSEDTFDNWLKNVKSTSATASKSWERVKLAVRDNHPTLLFDLAAYYNRDNPEKNETMLILFDHTKQYSQDDQAISFLALSVHELRAPLTLLRGYIEVFEEELEGKVDDELHGFMEKMHAQAEQLTAFVNNILNVARIDDDQLELKLEEADWEKILHTAIASLNIRAKVRGITLSVKCAPNLPTVGVDRLSVQEVLNNLVDNAVKYSGESKEVIIDAHLTQDGIVETTIQDHGLGIPTSIIPNLFSKFYRDHHNRAQIGGTGLGLYLSKAIVTAHGGNLWVRSHEGEGSTFGFTLLPYAQLSEDAKKNGSDNLTRSAHGWIKNHSLYRR